LLKEKHTHFFFTVEKHTHLKLSFKQTNQTQEKKIKLRNCNAEIRVKSYLEVLESEVKETSQTI
jgi:hypothetical protein